MNISNREFMKEAVVKPHLPFTHIIVRKEDNETVLGTVVCASKKTLSNMPVSRYAPAPREMKITLTDNISLISRHL